MSTSFDDFQRKTRERKLVNQGYTIWPGGDIPVPHQTRVSVVLADGCEKNLFAGELRWSNRESNPVIAYRLHQPPVEFVYLKGDVWMFNSIGSEFTRAYKVKTSGDTVYGTEHNTGNFDTENFVDLIGHRVPKGSYEATQHELKLNHVAIVDKGVKHDSDKPRFSLLPLKQVWDIVAVLEFGAKKYTPCGWQKVPDAENRYFDAAMRHLCAWRSGEKRDPETNLPHLAHAACCLLFLMWGDDQK